jgi:Mn-dependent DtxR family transcriptional regulator
LTELDKEILKLLAGRGEMSSGEIASHLKRDGRRVSGRLRVLRRLKYVERKSGKYKVVRFDW